MGFFSFLFGKPKGHKIEKIDRVYQKRETANVQLANYLFNNTTSSVRVVLYFFNETRAELEPLFHSHFSIVLVNGHLDNEIKKHVLTQAEVLLAEPSTYYEDEKRIWDVLAENKYTKGTGKNLQLLGGSFVRSFSS